MKNQKTKSDVIITFSLGVIALLFGLTMIILTYKGIINYEDNYNKILKLILGLIATIFGTVALILGIFYIIRYKKTKNVIVKGKKSICTIYDYKVHRGRWRPSYYMWVSYKGESGKNYINKFFVPLDIINDYPKGTKIECKIYGDDCYVDKERIVAVKDSFE